MHFPGDGDQQRESLPGHRGLRSGPEDERVYYEVTPSVFPAIAAGLHSGAVHVLKRGTKSGLFPTSRRAP